MTSTKRVLGIYRQTERHWVGDGFPVRTLFSYSQHGEQVSPFLLLDHAAPSPFTPTTARRGVGEHPHRGFETVTVVYQGALDHRDSSGGGGSIGPGDVQWMTAGSGIVHEEFHSPEFSAKGGTLEMVQLWVNLPSRLKMTPPRYQTLLDADIPSVPLPGGAGSVRVIAGTFGGHRGPAETSSPLGVWDVHLERGGTARFDVPDGWMAGLVVLRGSVRLDGDETADESEFVHVDTQGTRLDVEALTDAKFLMLTGEPLGEPIAGYGPFVMNTRAEIAQAIDDFNSGRFARIPGRTER